MNNLTLLEKELINEKVKELKRKTFWAMEEIKEHDELIGLYQDIIAETSKSGNGTIIFDYAKLLEQQNQLYSAEDAYLFARDSSNIYIKEILKQYLFSINQKMNDSNLFIKQQELFNEIHFLLGDTHNLITDFTQTYCRVNSAIADNIGFFIYLGWIAKFNTLLTQYGNPNITQSNIFASLE